MTVYSVVNPRHYVGLAADTKPTFTIATSSTTPDMPPGSEFLELDTGNRFIWDGSTWHEFENVLVSTS